MAIHTRSLSIRTKWTVLVVLAAALPLSLLSVRMLDIQKSGLEAEERALQVSVLDHASSRLSQMFDDAAEGTHRVGFLLTEAAITEDDARLALSQEALARAGSLEHVALYKPGGEFLDAIARKSMKPGSRLPAIPAESLRSGLNVKTWLPVVWEGNSPRLRYVESIVRDGERRLWVVGTIDAELLAKQIRGISQDHFEGRDDGVLLLSLEREKGPRVVVGALDGSLSLGSDLTGKDLAKDAKFENVIDKKLAFSTEFTSPAGEPMLGSLRVIADYRLALVARRPTAVVYQSLHRARKELLITASSVGLLALLVGAFMGFRATRPIGRLVELARGYGRREFARRSPIKTGDELETLGDSLSTMADEIQASEVEIARRALVQERLSRYLPDEVAKDVAEGRSLLELGGERRPITVLFADVTSFTTFAEDRAPEKVVAFLNELFTVLSEVVFRQGGTVDKFIGDSIMAIFGAPRSQDDHVERALAAAEDMHRFVEATSPAWREKFGIEVKLAIGVSTGDAIVGNLGSERRMDYTAIGDVVNIAARLESLAKPGKTLVTDEVAKAVGDSFEFMPLGTQPLRGKRKQVEILEVS